MQSAEYFQNKYGKSQASVGRLQLRIKEVVSDRDDLAEEVAMLGLKLKRVHSVSRSETETVVRVETVFRDSVVIRSGAMDTLRCIDYSDAWNRLAGCEDKGAFLGEIAVRDTLVQVVHRVPKRWWFFRWGTKGVRQELVSKNPYSRIVFSEYIEVQR